MYKKHIIHSEPKKYASALLLNNDAKYFKDKVIFEYHILHNYCNISTLSAILFHCYAVMGK